MNTDPNLTTYTDIARYLARLPAGSTVLLFSDDSLIWDHPTFQFLTSNIQGRRVTTIAALQDAVVHVKNVRVIVVLQNRASDFRSLLLTPGSLPAGQYAPHSNIGGKETYFTYTVLGT